MGEIKACSGPIAAAGGSITTSGTALGDVAAVVASTYGAAGATGDPGAAGSYSSMVATWTGELARLDSAVASIGRAASTSADLYAQVENAVASAFGGLG
jgi:uncharacterized protein YukE